MKKINFQVHLNQIIAAILLLSSLLWTSGAFAFDKVNKDSFDVAIKGYDTVAYFKEGRAVKGKSEFSHSWNEATWHFKNADNRELFAANPDHFAPQFGGY